LIDTYPYDTRAPVSVLCFFANANCICIFVIIYDIYNICYISVLGLLSCYSRRVTLRLPKVRTPSSREIRLRAPSLSAPDGWG